MSKDCIARFLVNFIHREIYNETEIKGIVVNKVKLFLCGKPGSDMSRLFLGVRSFIITDKGKQNQAKIIADAKNDD